MLGSNFIDNLLRDFRYSSRQLQKNLGFTFTSGVCARPGHVRQHLDFRFCGCRAHQVAALSRSGAPTRCFRKRLDVPSLQSFLS